MCGAVSFQIQDDDDADEDDAVTYSTVKTSSSSPGACTDLDQRGITESGSASLLNYNKYSSIC